MLSLITDMAILASLFTAVGLALGAPSATDPCAKIAGKTFNPPADALACMKSFPFNETLRQNVMSVISTVFDFYTFEYWYLNSPAPFEDSTVDIRAELARINNTVYDVSQPPSSLVRILIASRPIMTLTGMYMTL